MSGDRGSGPDAPDSGEKEDDGVKEEWEVDSDCTDGEGDGDGDDDGLREFELGISDGGGLGRLVGRRVTVEELFRG